ncbi:MAG: RNA 2',3'-cyclic phosphodiesterase [Candidatus Caldarchaeum sp.]|nr:RNA 2',3'-cyclic phosphodiesterase [Candidatus Caldarchaeum sp.]
MVRAFIAIDVHDEEILRRIVSVQNELIRVGREGLKPVEAHNLHLTLRFLGELTDAETQLVSEALGKLDAKAFTMSLKGLGYFPGGGRVNVIWAGVEEGAEELRKIHSSLGRLLSGLKIEENDKFSPHLTICRVKFVKDKQGLLEVIRRNSETFFGAERVEKISLKRSVLTSSGPVYSDISVRKI